MSTNHMAATSPDDARHVCPYGRVGRLDNWLRPLIHDPAKLFGPNLEAGMTALDVGCGGGYASMYMARQVGPSGLVIAADLQPEMLAHVQARAAREGLADRVRTHRCDEDRIGLEEEVDFAVAFFMAHEVPDPRAFFGELHDRLKPGGRLFLAEPLFHVSRGAFRGEVVLAEEVGFEVIRRPRVLGGRAVLLEKPA